MYKHIIAQHCYQDYRAAICSTVSILCTVALWVSFQKVCAFNKALKLVTMVTTITQVTGHHISVVALLPMKPQIHVAAMLLLLSVGLHVWGGPQ
jgi:hypothetical protein